jgi:hypothetical protein
MKRERPPTEREGLVSLRLAPDDQQSNATHLGAHLRSLHHLPGFAIISLLCLWLTRAFWGTQGLIAGTDSMGYMSRASQNAAGTTAFSIWDPSSMGGRRAFTLESGLGLLTKITQDPVWSVGGTILVLLLVAGFSAYWLSWNWFSSHAAAVICGVLYLASQTTLSQTASGHLNVLVLISLAPLALLYWWRGVTQFTMANAIKLGLIFFALGFARVDMPLYLMPMLTMVPLLLLLWDRGAWAERLRSAFLTTFVSGLVALATSMYLILPVIANVRASWLTGSQLFGTQSYLDRSLPLFESSLGFGRELGYIAFTGQQTWTSHPFLPFPVYVALSALIPLAALGALFFRRDAPTVFLASIGIIATFLGKGFRSPFGGAYGWVVQHVPVLGNLRDPTRWLMWQALAYSALAGLTVVSFSRRVVGEDASKMTPQHPRRLPVPAVVGLTLLILILMLLPTSPTLARGFLTWSPPASAISLLGAARDEKGQHLATIPFDQSRAFFQEGPYSGWEHDLGADSPLFAHVPSLGDGGWPQRSADFIAYESDLLAAKDPGWSSLLGGVGVSTLVDLGYPATDPGLPTGGTTRASTTEALSRMPGLTPVAFNAAGAVYRIGTASPEISFRPNLALVLGGRDGLAALPSLVPPPLSAWAAVTSDDALSTGGPPLLRSLIRRANLIVVSNETVEDIAPAIAAGFGDASGISSTMPLANSTQIVESDAAIRAGAMSSFGVEAPVSGPSTELFFDMSSAGRAKVWARVRSDPRAATLTFSADGHEIGEVTPMGLMADGFRWIEVGSSVLAAGKHQVAVRATPSRYGYAYQVDEIKVLPAGAVGKAARALARVLRQRSSSIAYSLDLNDAQKWFDPSPFAAGSGATQLAASYWLPIESQRVIRSAARSGENVARFELNGQRKYYSILEHYYSQPQDWTRRQYVFLKFCGSDSGDTYRFIITEADGASQQYLFNDSTQACRSLTFALEAPDIVEGARLDLGEVTHVRLALDDKSLAGSVAVTTPELSMAVTHVRLQYPIVPVDERRRVVLEGPDRVSSLTQLPPRGDLLSLDLSASQLGADHVVVPPATPIRTLPLVPVTWNRSSLNSYSVSVDAAEPGVLVLNEAYDSKWDLTGSSSAQHVPTQSLTNAYLLSSGRFRGTLSFTGQRYATIGWLITAATLTAALLALLTLFVLHRSSPSWKPILVSVILLLTVIVALPRIGAAGALAWDGTALRGATVDATGSTSYWHAVGRRDVTTQPLDNGLSGLSVRSQGGREAFAVLNHVFREPQDWKMDAILCLPLRAPPAPLLELDIYDVHGHYAAYTLATSGYWQLLRVNLGEPDRHAGEIDWSSVREVRISAATKATKIDASIGEAVPLEGGK